MLTKEKIEKKYPGKRLEKIKHLNLWGEDLENIDIISKMKALKVVCLSANKISSLKPFESLENLKEIYLRHNNISNIDEIDYLKKSQNLKSLWLAENPITENVDEFKKAIIQKLPNLDTLDNTQMSEIKKEIIKKNNDNKNNDEKKKTIKKEDLVKEKAETDKENINANNNIKEKNENKTEENIPKEEEKEKNEVKKDNGDNNIDYLFDKNINDKKENDNDKKEKGNENELKKTNNKLLVSTVDKLSDLLLEYEKEESTNNNENKSITNTNINDNSNILDSKSDIFKTGFSYKHKNETQNLQKENITPSNNKENQTPIENKENIPIEKEDKKNNENNNKSNINEEKDIHNPLRISSFKDQNNELLNDILKDVDTSQTIVRNNNTNKTIKINPNIINNENNNNINNNNNNDNNFTKNLNDMIKNSDMNVITSQSFKIGGNTGINNILQDVHTSQTMVKKNNDNNDINKILGEVNSSQTVIKRKDQEVNDILKDIETTASNFNKFNNKNVNNNFEKKKEDLKSIDDIRKIFNNEYSNDNSINNLYENNNVKDTRINNIFKSEMITSDSMLPNMNNSKKGPYRLQYPMMNKNYENRYEKKDNSLKKEKDMNNKLNINPNHMHKINAIINLLEDLNLENLLHVKNQIIKMLDK